MKPSTFNLSRAWVLLWAATLPLSLLAAKPRLDEVFHADKLAAIDAAITNAIAEKRLPGAVFWLERNGVAYHRAYGQRAVTPKPEPMTEDTVFDVASLTKVLATAPGLMRLVERGQVKLDARVQDYIPEFRRDGKDEITIRQLLTHVSGLRSGLGRSVDGPNSAIHFACQEKTNGAPGTVFRYSDINFILLGEVVQRVSHRPLAEYAEAHIFGPLKMRDTGYLPGSKLRKRTAPTEGSLRGTVHDPTARGMGGVAGHAGVFGTAADLARFARMTLNGGELEGARILEADTIKLMTSVQSPTNVAARRGLGWDIDSGYSRPRGTNFSIGTFGHTGFTGCILWIDPFSKSFYIFLSNRVHPDGRGNILSLYSVLGTLAAEAIVGFDFKNVPGALAPAPSSATNAAPAQEPGKQTPTNLPPTNPPAESRP